MEISSVVLDRMAQIHQQTLSTIQIASEAAALDFFYSLDGLDDEAMERWNAGLWTITFAAATAVAASTRSYLDQMSQYTSISVPLPNANLDWLEDDFKVWSDSPLVRVRTLADQDIENDIARAFFDSGPNVKKQMSAITRQVEQTTFEQMMNSPEWDAALDYTGEAPPVPARGTLDNIDELGRTMSAEGYPTVKGTSRPFRWARMPQAGACGWCRVVADRRYSDKSQQKNPMGAWHTFCRCSWRKITVEESRNWEAQYDGDWQDVITERADASVSAGAGEPT